MHSNRLLLTGYRLKVVKLQLNLKSGPKITRPVASSAPRKIKMFAISKVGQVQNAFPEKLTRRSFEGELALRYCVILGNFLFHFHTRICIYDENWSSRFPYMTLGLVGGSNF